MPSITVALSQHLADIGFSILLLRVWDFIFTSCGFVRRGTMIFCHHPVQDIAFADDKDPRWGACLSLLNGKKNPVSNYSNEDGP